MKCLPPQCLTRLKLTIERRRYERKICTGEINTTVRSGRVNLRLHLSTSFKLARSVLKPLSVKMSSFRNSTADREPLDSFRSCVHGSASGAGARSNAALPLHLFEWMEDGPTGSESSGLKSITDLESQNQALVRVVYVSLQVSHTNVADEIRVRKPIPMFATAYAAKRNIG